MHTEPTIKMASAATHAGSHLLQGSWSNEQELSTINLELFCQAAFKTKASTPTEAILSTLCSQS
jgi:hypothetical protein